MSSLFVVDGMKRPSFTVNIDVERATVADLFSEVAKSYELEFNPKSNLRIIFVDKELKYTRKKKLCDVGIINHSTIAVIFRLPDRHPAATTEDADVVECAEVKINEENKEAEEVSAAVKTADETKDANEVSVAESEAVKNDEDAKQSSTAHPEPVKKDEDAKNAKEVSAKESEPVKINEGNKDANEVSDASKNAVNATVPTTVVSNITAAIPAAGRVEKEEKRPVLQRLPGVVELAFLPDFLNFDFAQTRAMLPCRHVMGSDTMRSYCQNLIDNGNTKFACPYVLFPFLPGSCPAVWHYRLVRHVACFTTNEMHETEKAIAINFVGKDSITLTCPGCFTWCSKVDPKMTRLRCFLCTRETGKEFLFCGYCLREWKNARSGRCANPECKSIEKTVDILRNSPVTSLYGGTWPTIRLCPRCGILTEFMGQCSQVHCQLCGYDYCFLCLKGDKSKAELKCDPFFSPCQRASLQTSIPEWDGHDSD